MSQKTISQLINELELMIKKALTIKIDLKNQIFYSKLSNLILNSILKIILLKKNWKNYESKIQQYELEQIVLETSKVMNYSEDKSKALLETIIKLNKLSEESYIKNIKSEEFIIIIKNAFLLITILTFHNSLNNNYDLYIKLIKKIESFETSTKLDELFQNEWNEFIRNGKIVKKLSIHYPLDIYLDQKDWILLARVWKNKENDPKIKILLQKLFLLVDFGLVRIPLSINHLIETANRKNEASRKALIDLMIILSKGYTIIPYVTIIPYEIKNTAYKRLGMKDKIIPIKNIIFSRGIGNILGAKPTIQRTVKEKNQFDKEALEAIMYSPEALRFGFSIKDNEMYTERLKRDKQLLDKIEQNRILFEKQFKDNNLRKKARLAQHFKDEISPILGKILTDENIPKENVAKIIGKNLKECVAFMKEMPTSFCSFALTRRRDEQISSKAHEHDLYDIAALSIAIPYCDIVVCEKRFGSFAKDEQLDVKYHTLILKNLKELEDYLWS